MKHKYYNFRIQISNLLGKICVLFFKLHLKTKKCKKCISTANDTEYSSVPSWIQALHLSSLYESEAVGLFAKQYECLLTQLGAQIKVKQNNVLTWQMSHGECCWGIGMTDHKIGRVHIRTTVNEIVNQYFLPSSKMIILTLTERYM